MNAQKTIESWLRNIEFQVAYIVFHHQVPYLVGEIFVLEAPDVVQTMLEKRKYAITIAPDATLSLLAQIYSLIVDKK